MKCFIDTSTLMKKYIEEKGSQRLEKFIEDVFEIVVSPITMMEVNSALERRLREQTLSINECELIERELKTDYIYFGIVKWNDNFEKKSIEIIRKYQIKVLDSMQLTAGILSNSDLFLTSDKKLFEMAKREHNKVIFI